ncbi:hypothetical protein KP509_32G022900 [Ceratopteris richardii]|uniref:Protein kinase domain-containing protein n=1 Tax=Ceratopteris richardii TaxID=49495 RepID=A0A8T2QT55_CERRI|nr:hypothetical protein KP509_32G022900 [Ceratopteris richardii]
MRVSADAHFGRMEEHFEMEEELMQAGKQGVIRLCVDKLSGHVYVCKSVFLEGCSDEKARNARSEIATLTIVQLHPNIVALISHFEGTSAIHMIMEHCEGGDLFEHLSLKWRQYVQPYQACTRHDGGGQYTALKGWYLSEKDVAQIFMASLKAVAFCHDHGIMHGDIKLENLLLPHHGCSYSDIKLCDFGSAAPFSAAGKRNSVRRRICTFTYAAPEIIQAARNREEHCVDEKGDIWSLGVLLYLLVFWRLPFAGDTPKELLNSMRDDLADDDWLDNRFERLPHPEVSLLARNLLKNMMQLDPLKRPSARSLLMHPWMMRYNGLASNVAPNQSRKFEHSLCESCSSPTS